MMMRRLLLTLVVVAGCARADAERVAPPPDERKPAPAIAPNFAKPPPPAKIAVQLTAVTLADECGGTAPTSAPVAPATKAKAKSASKSDRAGARAKRRCEQTSMQLAITTAAAARIQVKSVELFNSAGKSLGTLTSSKPTRWSVDKGMYETWNETAPAGSQINVSYALQRPDWARIGDRWNQTYTLKAVITIGGVDRSVQKQVTIEAPASLPPDVKT